MLKSSSYRSRRRQLDIEAMLVKKKLAADIAHIEADASDRESLNENPFETTVKVKE